ncbi:MULTISPECIES: MobH family relaxase [unclassified Shewanella]|uniref:MobH family relaxase n=1 Tax=unclassified Shewanella TaxID=196818 RepID=UPI000CC5312C|nr:MULTISPECIES: MobH family relaxase [unclassified Shewanella]PIX72210.1 MAG: hypothetical protein COZ42_06575 [Shewanella sp. CG_4_10_14_3_um_filter_42_91]PIY65026.1 MAG: hypothetical protein COY92_14390 [Shewanella sp. CG_4_10_14_0_8_um_filter_42_13]
MSSLSIHAFKFRVLLNSLWSRIDVWKSVKSKTELEDERKLDAVLHYPLKTASIPLVQIESLLNRHKDKIRIIERDIGLIHKGCEFNFVDLVESTIRAYIGYCHLIPASEMDHHQYIGGLLEHSLDVSIRSLQFSMSFMLDQMGLVDEDQARRPRYEFAAWVCGLLHDAGKIISNVQVIGSNGEIWRPLNESIFDWAERNQIKEYTVVHQKERLQNDHETNSVHFLPLVLNDVAKNYLIGSHDDLYSMITQTLVHYHSYKGYLFNAVRKADSESTYEDYARVWLHDSSRKKSLTIGVVNAMRSLYSNWVVNKIGGDLFVFNHQVFLSADRPISDVIKKCIDYEIKLPTSPKALISILLDKRILSKVSDKSTFANLYLGEFTEENIHEFAECKTGPMARISPITVILVEWANFVVGDNPLPGEVHGALRYNTSANKNVHKLCNNQGVSIVVPKDSAVDEQLAELSPEEMQPIPTNNESVNPEPKAKPKPKPKAKPKTATKSPSTNSANTDKSDPESKVGKDPISAPATVSSTEAVSEGGTSDNQPVTAMKPIVRNNTESKPKNIEPNSSAVEETVNTDYPWIVKQRRPKPVDKALAELLKAPDDNFIWIDNGDVCVNMSFLTERTDQFSAQIINAMSFLKLLKKNCKGKEISILDKPDNKVMYVLLNDTLSKLFLPILLANKLSEPPKDIESSDVETSNQDGESLPEPPKDIKPSDVETSNQDGESLPEPPKDIRPSDVETSNQDVSDDGDDIDDLTSEATLMEYSQLISKLKSVCPTLKNSELRDFCKAEGIAPIVTESGQINIEITSVQLDELKWKLRDNNE